MTGTPPSLSPGARKVLAGLVFFLLVAIYLEGFPPRVANPIHFLGLGTIVLLLTSSTSTGPSLAALLLFGGGGLILGDLGFRLTLADKLYYRPNERFLRRMPEFPFLHRYVPNTDAVVPTLGDLEAMRLPTGPRQTRPLRFRTDALGFRNDPGPGELPYDVLLLGDSFVMGAGLDQKDTWANQLTRDHHLQTYSLSFPANPWQELMLLQATLPKLNLKPGALVLWTVFTGNDHLGGSGPTRLPPPADWGKRLKTQLANYRNRNPVRLLLQRVFPSQNYAKEDPGRGEVVVSAPIPDGGEMLFYRDYLEAATMSRERLLEMPGVKDFGEVIRAMHEYVEGAGFRLKVAILPTKLEVYPHLAPTGRPRPPEKTAFAQLFQELCETHGVPVLDLGPGFRRAAQELSPTFAKRLWWDDDSHWNAAGAAVAANLVAGWEGLGLVPISDMSAM